MFGDQEMILCPVGMIMICSLVEMVDGLLGDAGMDTLYGGHGDDELHGGINNDLLYGNSGTNTILGDAGDDTLVGGNGIDAFDGGDGFDTVTYELSTGGVSINLTTPFLNYGDAAGDTFVGIERIVGPRYADFSLIYFL